MAILTVLLNFIIVVINMISVIIKLTQLSLLFLIFFCIKEVAIVKLSSGDCDCYKV